LLEHGIGTACMGRLVAEWTGSTRKKRSCLLANRLRHRYGVGCAVDSSDLLADPVCAELGIDGSWLEQTDRHAPGLVEVAKKILG
jgi:hypothetical protein